MSARVGGFCFCLIVLLSMVMPLNAGAQSINDARPGITLATAHSLTNPAMRYAVYLPTNYDTTRTWPVAFLLDPRGRALVPLDRMKNSAEKHGYVLISSYNTRSDTAVDVNVHAMSAMLNDAQKQLSIDPRRVYLVGFSGTSRLAWDFAAVLEGAVAGILGAGATGINFAHAVAADGRVVPKPAYFGVIGETDFTYDEIQSFEPWLQQKKIPYRIRSFKGGHTWPPDSLFDEAVAWFELRASAAGLKPADSALINNSFVRDTAAANSLERNRQPVEAWQRWVEIAADYEGAYRKLAVKNVARLGANAEKKRIVNLRQHLNQRFAAFHRVLSRWVDEVRLSKGPPDVKAAIRRLGLDERIERAAENRPEYGVAATRELEHAFVILSFYEPRQLLQQGKPEHALALLELAELIKPGRPGTQLHRAYALLILQREQDAMTALENAVAAGLDAGMLINDPSLKALANNPRFLALVSLRNREPY